MAGHYSEAVWQESDKIGCAVVWCPGMTFVGCEYNPGRDEALCISSRIRSPSYGTHYNDHYDNDEKANYHYNDTNYDYNEATVPVSCPGLNNGMTDEVREMFLNRHNNYRSLIASGRAMNKLGGFAPKAARMMKTVRLHHDLIRLLPHRVL
ncbi:unnamed protein product [Haemonchus placei]|uniref:SCP domain-containing protein n=1 Tax=Haemonchus placei TaxID=6290 RepID=A0A0N4WTI1_HAEPC|nr:unnamed protein product [Haemonchus placei]